MDVDDVAKEGSNYAITNRTRTTEAAAIEETLGNHLYRYEFISGKLTNPKLFLDLPPFLDLLIVVR